ncbi:GNAT family N-acetyltransferase [Isachenkonia alkalipeptolytica]|uniref:GNAT family N-acetyltransferase n=1 Tax=Isachenkonia alkalipeptolytica TaxID=2565777 RepID=A0AA44BEX6_9CLOT|nr:GNAT family N-acetyltransferase [Isachenkonia alkalipeptolytica]NBG89413.1 GNAT family N-acetyltransferase [Isachenkonia alkalipeptolytica]
MSIEYCVNTRINGKELTEVFKSVGWNKDEKVIVQAFENSFFVLAYNKEELIGFARAISDGYFYTGIYDVVVRPPFQGKGIAKRMMKILLKEFNGTYFFLTYTDGNREFYEKCGFKENDQALWIPK